MREGKPFENGHSVSDTISRIQNQSCCSSWGIEGQDSLYGDIEGWNIELLEKDLSHVLSVNFGVQGCLSH